MVMNHIQISEHELKTEVFTPEVVNYLLEMTRKFRERRDQLLQERQTRQTLFNTGSRPDFLPETSEIRDSSWIVAEPPADLNDRRVEITGPVDRKMMINALNSGAKVFMADFEDSTSPTWNNIVRGQINVRDAVYQNLSLTQDGKDYNLKEKTATLMVRPRGWHLPENHIIIDGSPAPASLIDFGLTVFHTAEAALARESGCYFYLPKLESHLEARLWNDVFCFTEDFMNIPQGTIRATVLIETILAAFEMDEILYELREHSAGLNAGRWDYIFSVAKKFANDPLFVLPDRADVKMTVPFMRAYTELLVATCHKRGAHAIGGMSAFIPNRNNPEITAEALKQVSEDKRREVTDGCDGTWVAHPDLIPVAQTEFDAVLGNSPNQIENKRDDVNITADNLLSVSSTGGEITADGLRTNVYVGIRYLASWLNGTGAAAINNLMEDAATAEISRAQIWQWVHHKCQLSDGTEITKDLVRSLIDEQLDLIAKEIGYETYTSTPYDEARKIFEQVALTDEFVDFLTLPAYKHLK